MNILGIHLLHNWNKWARCPLVASSLFYDSHIVEGQSRVCNDCGLEQIRAIN